MDYEETGRNIKCARVRKDLKQEQLAEIVGVTKEHISHVERASSRPSLELLVMLANALSCDINDLLGNNMEFRSLSNADEELNELLKTASPALRRQCKEICRTAIRYGSWTISE